MPGSEKKQYQIVVKGKVQRVGFRDKVEDLADDLGLYGFVQNRSSKDVIILVEGDELKLMEFTHAIQHFPPPVRVKGIEFSETPYTGEYTEFLIIRGQPVEELAERFDSAIFYLHDINSKQDRMLDKQDQMLEKQDRMLDKQDQMLEKQDRMLDKQDQMLGKQDTVIGLQRETLSEVKGVRSDFQKSFSEELVEVRREIAELRLAMILAGYIKKADVQ